MPILQKPFEIAYCGVTTKITPVVRGADMQYIVSLPTREVTIETVFDENELDHWEEVQAGRTTLAEEIGAIIKEKDE